MTYAEVAAPAVRKVTQAVKAGRLTRAATCEECGGPGPIQGHHHRGYEPEHELDVVWLCKPCHRIRHGRRAAVPSWERGARAYARTTGRVWVRPGDHPTTYQFSSWSSPSRLLKAIGRLWALLRTDEERAAVVALVNELAAQNVETAA